MARKKVSLDTKNKSFLPTEKLQKLGSVDYHSKTVGELFHGIYKDRRTTSRRPSMESQYGDQGRYRLGSLTNDPAEYDWDRLRKEVGKHGIQKPVEVNRGTLTNGHHRAMMAIEQGHLFVPVENYD